MDIQMPIALDARNMVLGSNSSSGNSTNGADFLNLITSLLSKGSDGKDALITLLKSGSLGQDNMSKLDLEELNGEESLDMLSSSLESLGESKNTISSLMKILNLKINGEDSSFKRDNFIIGNLEIDDVLSNIKDLSKNASDENLSKYINGINQDNGFLQLKAMHSLNLQAQNSNIASTIQGMILNYSNGNENKDALNALKFLQQFTTEDGALDTGNLIKALEGKGKNHDASSFMNSMNLTQEHIQNSTGVITKEASIFKNTDIVDVVVENFKTLRLPGRCEMRIKLNPKELGDITIKLVLEKGEVSVAVTASKKETVALLQSNINTLIEQMKDSGNDIHHVAINLSQEQNGEEARRGYKEEKEEKSEDEFENIFDDISSENEFVNSII